MEGGGKRKNSVTKLKEHCALSLGYLALGNPAFLDKINVHSSKDSFSCGKRRPLSSSLPWVRPSPV